MFMHLVVAGDGNVDVSEGRVGVAERDGGNVYVRSFSQRLVVGTGVSYDQEAGLPEGRLNLIGEGSRGEAPGESGGAGGSSEFKHGPLEKKPIRNQTFNGLFRVHRAFTIHTVIKHLNIAVHCASALFQL